ncbi:MAG: GIY-YIG nuclease family protein [Lacunisphaera sp.]
MYFVYILACLETRRTYGGQTDNLIRRFHAHQQGSTRTTRERLRQPAMLYWESYATRAEAMHRERYFKAGAGHRLKQRIVADGLLLFSQG